MPTVSVTEFEEVDIDGDVDKEDTDIHVINVDNPQFVNGKKVIEVREGLSGFIQCRLESGGGGGVRKNN